jgi:hypothetical protein
VEIMTTSPVPVTAEQLHAMFLKNYPEPSSETLSINAGVITENHPQIASLMLRIDAASTDRAGRATALEFIGSVLEDTSITNDGRETRASTPDETRDHAEYLWDFPDTKNNMMRSWALTNAAQETGNPIEEFHSRKRETMCERFHERHIASHLHTPNYEFGKFWHDSFYADEYWRGLAAFCIIGDWYGNEPAYAFILWAGQQEDITAVTKIAMERRTIDTGEIAAVLEYKDVVSPSILEGVL